MPTYITLYKLTDQGIKNIKDAPGRIEEAIKGFEAMGGKLTGIYAVMGEYDYVAIGELPNDEIAMTFALAESIRSEPLLKDVKESQCATLSTSNNSLVCVLNLHKIGSLKNAGTVNLSQGKQLLKNLQKSHE